MSTFKKYRKKRKIDLLPDEIKEQLDEALMDSSNTYIEISGWLKKEGYNISKTAIGNYAIESKKLAYRMLETTAKVQEIVKIAKQNKDSEATTEAALQIASSKLAEKIALIEEELELLDAETTINLIVKLSRTKAYKDKIYAGLKDQYEVAFESFKESVYKELNAYPEIRDKLVEIATTTLGKVMK